GFFAAPKTAARQALLDNRLFAFGVGLERRGVGARNPLTQTGLVLAGANLPPRQADADHGILLAEAIAGLNLNGLELAVLSACETGLGETGTTLAEGVFGLQRAFHLGGCRNVIASLWKVDDEATAALMGVFYDRLFRQKLSPAEALREAQLVLYRHPERIPVLAGDRSGPVFAKTVRLPPAPQAGVTGPGARAASKLWAAFVLSGLGR